MRLNHYGQNVNVNKADEINKTEIVVIEYMSVTR